MHSFAPFWSIAINISILRGITVYQLILNRVCASRVGNANNMNKLSLVGMQLPEKYKENFDVSSELRPFVTPDEGPSLETWKFSLYFSGSCIHIPTKACSCQLIWLT